MKLERISAYSMILEKLDLGLTSLHINVEKKTKNSKTRSPFIQIATNYNITCNFYNVGLKAHGPLLFSAALTLFALFLCVLLKERSIYVGGVTREFIDTTINRHDTSSKRQFINTTIQEIGLFIDTTIHRIETIHRHDSLSNNFNFMNYKCIYLFLLFTFFRVSVVCLYNPFKNKFIYGFKG